MGVIGKIQRFFTEQGRYITMDLERQVFNDLKRHEGCVLKPYRDTVGVWTIGYGHTHGVTALTKPITQDKAEQYLKEDMIHAFEVARKLFPNYSDLDKVRKSVLVNMAFNLGQTKLAKFYATIRAVKEENYVQAALQMLASKWASQVGQRSKELANRMASGRIDPHHLVT